MSDSMKSARGMSLIEVMVAMGLLAVALLGVAGAHVAAAGTLSYSKRTVEATALAQELAGVLGALPYTSSGTAPTGLFANATTANDGDVLDLAGKIDAATATTPVTSSIADHAEAELPAGVLAALSPLGGTIPNSTTPVYERYWNIAPIADPLTPANVGGVTIAVIVRWPLGAGAVNTGYNHVAVVTTRFDPTQIRE